VHGIDPERLVFAPRQPLPVHLARHPNADLFLDTLPCNAHTTASDSLWAGVPVLTCAGNTFAGRVAASLVNAVGLPELITASLGELKGSGNVFGKISRKVPRPLKGCRLHSAKLASSSYSRESTRVPESRRAAGRMRSRVIILERTSRPSMIDLRRGKGYRCGVTFYVSR
jgi:glycosyl transferase family 41